MPAVAVSVTLPPWQKVVAPEGVIVGVNIVALHGPAAGDNVSPLLEVTVIKSISRLVLLGNIDNKWFPIVKFEKLIMLLVLAS